MARAAALRKCIGEAIIHLEYLHISSIQLGHVFSGLCTSLTWDAVISRMSIRISKVMGVVFYICTLPYRTDSSTYTNSFYTYTFHILLFPMHKLSTTRSRSLFFYLKQFLVLQLINILRLLARIVITTYSYVNLVFNPTLNIRVLWMQIKPLSIFRIASGSLDENLPPLFGLWLEVWEVDGKTVR